MKKYIDQKEWLEPLGMTLKEAVEKQIPKKPSERKYPWAICSACAGSINMENVREHVQNLEVSHCEHCGQAIDWSEA